MSHYFLTVPQKRIHQCPGSDLEFSGKLGIPVIYLSIIEYILILS